MELILIAGWWFLGIVGFLALDLLYSMDTGDKSMPEGGWDFSWIMAAIIGPVVFGPLLVLVFVVVWRIVFSQRRGWM